MGRRKKRKVLNPSVLRGILINRFVPVVTAAVVVMAALVAYNLFILKPEYKSTATFYISEQSDNQSGTESDNDDTLLSGTVEDCTYFIKSHSVLDSVIENLSLEISYEELCGCISVVNPKSTRILEVTVKSDSPSDAKRIADAVCSIAPQKIKNVMGSDRISVYETGTIEDEPSNTTGAAVYLLFGFAAAVVMYAVFLIMYLLDDSIYSDKDIEAYLGLNVIGSIPNAFDTPENQISCVTRKLESSVPNRIIDSE